MGRLLCWLVGVSLLIGEKTVGKKNLVGERILQIPFFVAIWGISSNVVHKKNEKI